MTFAPASAFLAQGPAGDIVCVPRILEVAACFRWTEMAAVAETTTSAREWRKSVGHVLAFLPMHNPDATKSSKAGPTNAKPWADVSAAPPPYALLEETTAVPEDAAVHVEDESQPLHPPESSPFPPNAANIPYVSTDKPICIYCPRCQQNIMTRVDFVLSSKAWILSGLTFVLAFPLFWIPLVVGFKDKVHVCPACRTLLATVQS